MLGSIAGSAALRNPASLPRIVHCSYRRSASYARAMDAKHVSITSAFDSGNIEVVDSNDTTNIQLKIRPDPFTASENCAHYQWFHFQVAGVFHVYLECIAATSMVNTMPSTAPIKITCCVQQTRPSAPVSCPKERLLISVACALSSVLFPDIKAQTCLNLHPCFGCNLQSA